MTHRILFSLAALLITTTSAFAVDVTTASPQSRAGAAKPAPRQMQTVLPAFNPSQFADDNGITCNGNWCKGMRRIEADLESGTLKDVITDDPTDCVGFEDLAQATCPWQPTPIKVAAMMNLYGTLNAEAIGARQP